MLSLRINLALAWAAAGVVSWSAEAQMPSVSSVSSERIWVAGRYDDRSVVMYFGTAHFRDSVPASARKIRPPKASAFFDPEEMSLADIERFRDSTSTERFAVGDRYDLVLDGGHVATVTLSSLVGFESDEQVGNDSYVGAIATIAAPDLPFFTMDYYAVRPLGESRGRASRVGIERAPPSAQTRSRIASVLRAALSADSDSTVRQDARTLPLVVSDVTTLRLADGSRRYYARGIMSSTGGTACTKVEAWLAPSRDRAGVRLLIADASSCRFDIPDEAPNVLNLVDLGRGRIAVIAELPGADGRSLAMFEYTDGVPLSRMRVLQTFGVSE